MLYKLNIMKPMCRATLVVNIKVSPTKWVESYKRSLLDNFQSLIQILFSKLYRLVSILRCYIRSNSTKSLHLFYCSATVEEAQNYK